MEQSKSQSNLGPITLNGRIIYGMDPNAELIGELNYELKELKEDLRDMNDLLDDLGYNIQLNTPKLNIITQNIENTDINIEQATDVLVTVDQEINQPIGKPIQILGGTVGGAVVGGVGFFFGIIPGIVGLGLGAGLGATITSGILYVKEKFF
jgi:hypothetical protein